MHLRAALSWLFVAGATGCILFVDSETTFSDRCRFAGDATSACGNCIANACRAKVDACCAEEGCRGAVLDKLDQCSSGSNAEGCGLVQYAQGSANVTQLQDCVRASCATQCAGSAAADGGRPPPPKSAYTTYCTAGSSGQCSCSVYDYLKNETECSERTVPGSICCAQIGWPKSYTSCYCRKRSCSQSGTTSCSCSTSESTGSTVTSCGQPTGGSCCKSATTYSTGCRCGSGTTCTAPDTRVSSCTAADVGCQSDETHVDSCSQ